MFSSVLPAICACMPQELLPIIPPSVLWVCVAGSGPNHRPYGAAAARRSSSTMPGSTRAQPSSALISSTRLRYLEQSSTTATLQHSPASDVPPPRARIGAPYRRAISTVATTSSALRGTTTPIGTWR